MAKENLVAFGVSSCTPTTRWLASLSDGRTVIQDRRKGAPDAWHRLREFLRANPTLTITGLRLQGIGGATVIMPSHQAGYFFGFKTKAVVGGPQTNFVGVGFCDGSTVTVCWTTRPRHDHCVLETRTKDKAGFMLIENPSHVS